MKHRVRGVIHVHSDFSKDALCSVADIAEYARDAALQFVGLTDHAEDLSSDDVKTLLEECQKHSDESCVLIPGLEYRCTGDTHILGVGVTDNLATSDPVAIAAHIRASGGVAILAHPGRNAYDYPQELFTVLDGIEIWNVSENGKFRPSLVSLRLLRAAQPSNPRLLGFGGEDLHWVDGPPGVTLELLDKISANIDKEAIMDCLRLGKFRLRGAWPPFDWLIRLCVHLDRRRAQ